MNNFIVCWDTPTNDYAIYYLRDWFYTFYSARRTGEPDDELISRMIHMNQEWERNIS